jgi:hypothetical protein
MRKLTAKEVEHLGPEFHADGDRLDTCRCVASYSSRVARMLLFESAA